MGIAGGLIVAIAIIIATSFVSSSLGGFSTNGSLAAANRASVTTVYGVVTSTIVSTEAASLSSSLTVPEAVTSSVTSGIYVAPNVTAATTTVTTTATATAYYTFSSTAVQTSATVVSAATSSTTTAEQSSYAHGSNTSAGAQTVVTMVTTATTTSTIPSGIKESFGLADIAIPRGHSTPNNSPSSIRALLTTPTQSAIVLLPILLAVILGLVFFRASSTREES